MPTQEDFVNGFTVTWVDWAEVGLSPYLHDTLVDNITSFTDAQMEGAFTFPVSGLAGGFVACRLSFYLIVSSDLTGAHVDVWDGVGWTRYANAIGFDSAAGSHWETIAVPVINTLAKADGLQVRVECQRSGLASTITIYKCKRLIDYVGGTQPLMDGFFFVQFLRNLERGRKFYTFNRTRR